MISALSSCLTGPIPYYPYDVANTIIPSSNIHQPVDALPGQYSMGGRSLSNETFTYESRDLMADFAVIENFAKKILQEQLEIDSDIQRVINDHFWEML